MFLRLRPLEVIFVDHHAYAAPAPVLEAAHHAAMTIDLHVVAGTDHVAGKQNRELHQGTDWNVAIHGEQHAVGRNIFRLCRVGACLRLDLNGQMQRESWRTLHFCIVLDGDLRSLWIHHFLLFCWHRRCAFLPRTPQRFLDFAELWADYTAESSSQSY